jgi:maltose alpha-D-glucosyltransferase/alpha-amylase
MAPDPRWYQDAVIYQIDVETFRDSDGDGIGDLTGVVESLDYLAGVGVTCLWLQPFYPSPERDGGYDVADFYGVSPRFGSLGDVVELTREAASHGIRVIVDLVMQHTSDQHPWFRSAVKDPTSRFRDYYFWTDGAPAPDAAPPAILRLNREDVIWSRHRDAGGYYRHWFYDFEPDLNYFNPAVAKELHKVVAFWLRLGCSGFRVDALPWMIDTTGVADPPGDPYDVVRTMRMVADSLDPSALFVGEADHDLLRAATFFGEGDQVQLIFNFTLAATLFSVLQSCDAGPIARLFAEMPKPPPGCGWATFLRNHDELNLQPLPPEEREVVYDGMAPDPDMHSQWRGIRRRLSPMLEDPRRVRMAWSLLLSLPGTPVIYYGDEIGMGDDQGQDGRDAVRTAMQWSPDRNGGFSTAEAGQLVVPVIDSGPYRYQEVNVVDQLRDPGSLLNWMAQALRIRRTARELGAGSYQPIETSNQRVEAHRVRGEDGELVAIHNLDAEPVRVRVRANFDDLRTVFSPEGEEPELGGGEMELPGYGYAWLRERGIPFPNSSKR